MKFRSKDGREFDSIVEAYRAFRCPGPCTSCGLHENCNSEWVSANQEEAAKIMGYELIRDEGPGPDTPALEYNPKDMAFPTEPDMVNHPPHYTQGGIECIDALTAMISPYKDPNDAALSWQVVKYIWRHPFKGKPLEDLKKARYYLDRLIQRYEDGL